MTMDQPLTLAAVPMPLRWLREPLRWHSDDGTSLTIVAGGRTDLFVDPGGGSEALNAPCLLGLPGGDFQLSARVTVELGATYDAGVLLLHAHDRAWAKLCLELSPQGRAMVVSVVTRGVSDDCNSMVVDGPQVWLRVARMGAAFAFHASTDGAFWQLVRYFALEEAERTAVGFLAQSPTGEGCSATFDRIRYTPRGLDDLRDGR
jgi:regulation of enolase protein 1 (concanavalin A-like superfamily)